MTDDGLSAHVLGLLEADERAEWGWRALEVLPSDDRRWAAPPTLRLSAGGLLVPMYNGYVELDVAARTVTFIGIDQRAPHEWRDEHRPDDGWWRRAAQHPAVRAAGQKSTDA